MTAAPFPDSRSATVDFDQLAVHAVRRLQQRQAPGSWGVVRTAVLGSISFGLLPLFSWPVLFHRYVSDETEALRELAQWARRRGGNQRDAERLAAAVERTAAPPAFGVWTVLIGIFVLCLLAMQLRAPYGSIDALIGVTYNYGQPSSMSPFFGRGHHFGYAHDVHRTWVIAVSAAYAMLWFRICGHARAVRRCVKQINTVVKKYNLRPIRLPRHSGGAFVPAWALMAVVMAMYGVWWGIPMAVAGIAQRRYTNGTGPLLRTELATRFRQILACPAPAMAAHDPVRCGNAYCLAPLHPAARFCSRCGAGVVRTVAAVQA